MTSDSSILSTGTVIHDTVFEEIVNAISPKAITSGNKEILEAFVDILAEVSPTSVNIIDEKAIITTTDVEIDDEDITVLDLWKNYVEEVDMEKSERIIVTEIFEEAYLRVTVGDV